MTGIDRDGRLRNWLFPPGARAFFGRSAFVSTAVHSKKTRLQYSRFAEI